MALNGIVALLSSMPCYWQPSIRWHGDCCRGQCLLPSCSPHIIPETEVIFR